METVVKGDESISWLGEVDISGELGNEMGVIGVSIEECSMRAIGERRWAGDDGGLWGAINCYKEWQGSVKTI